MLFIHREDKKVKTTIGAVNEGYNDFSPLLNIPITLLYIQKKPSSILGYLKAQKCTLFSFYLIGLTTKAYKVV